MHIDQLLKYCSSILCYSLLWPSYLFISKGGAFHDQTQQHDSRYCKRLATNEMEKFGVHLSYVCYINNESLRA